MAASGDAATSGVNALSQADRDGGTDEVGRERGTHRDRHRVAHRDGLRADRQSDRFRVSPGLTASVVQTTDG